jgi:hypothetical protein
MPRGPGGDRRPIDTVGCAVTVAKIATQEIEYPKEMPRQTGKARSGRVRADALRPERRMEIARQAASTRWAAKRGDA